MTPIGADPIPLPPVLITMLEFNLNMQCMDFGPGITGPTEKASSSKTSVESRMDTPLWVCFSPPETNQVATKKALVHSIIHFTHVIHYYDQ